MIIVSAKISTVLSACVSRPGVYVISNLVGRVCTADQLYRAFGPTTIFAINPWHPRHVVSIVAVILITPCVVQSTYKSFKWALRQVSIIKADSSNTSLQDRFMTDRKVRFLSVFNFLTSRVTLHVSNQLAHAVI